MDGVSYGYANNNVRLYSNRILFNFCTNKDKKTTSNHKNSKNENNNQSASISTSRTTSEQLQK